MYNAESYVAACFEHLLAHGVEIYLLDNESTDHTVERAQEFLGRGLIAIETLPRGGVFDWTKILARKQELAYTLDADWFIHQDVDELRVPPRSDETLAQAIARVDAAGYNAIHFDQYDFIPTREMPDHAHPEFFKTMRWYYPFELYSLHHIKGWQKQAAPVNLTETNGHRVLFPNLHVYPTPFKLKHYPFLSADDARKKYSARAYPQNARQAFLHGWHLNFDASQEIELPAQSDLCEYISDDALAVIQPRKTLFLQDQIARHRAPQPTAAPEPPAPFIVGMGRSGTSLLRRMLDAHPALAVPPETDFHYTLYVHTLTASDPLETFLNELQANPHAAKWEINFQALRARLAELQPFALAPALRAFYLHYAAQYGKTRWGEKTPGNLKHLQAIQSVLPEAHFIHILRDGRAVSVSRQRMNLAAPTLAQEALHWEAYVLAARAIAPRLQHYLEVRYEELVQQPEAVLRRICAFIDLPYHPQMLDYPAVFAARSQAEQREAAPPVKGSTDLLKYPPDPARSTRWRDELTAYQIREIEMLIGKTLRELGYD